MTELLHQVAEKIYQGHVSAVTALVQEGLDQGIEADKLLSSGLITGMDKVGRDFKNGILFVPEVLVAGRAMQAGMDVLKPSLNAAEISTRGICVIGTVEGDLHDIGKNLVKMMLEGSGFTVIDLGVNVSPTSFVDAVRQHQPHFVGLSALLTTTMAKMSLCIQALAEAGQRDSIKIMVGGAPVTATFAEEIGADSYGPDAATAVDIARAFVS